MEQVYLSKPIEITAIGDALKQLFPRLIFFNWDLVDEPPLGFNAENRMHIVYIVYQLTLEREIKGFNYLLEIYRTPDRYSQERALYIGKQFSTLFDCGVIVPYSLPERIEFPYYSILFDKNKTLLVDDLNTSETGEQVVIKILGTQVLPTYSFDDIGILEI